MKPLILASTRKDAGKTSLLVGLAKATGRTIGYLKPLGDRFLYRKKRLWDYDASLVAGLFDLGDEPERTSIGFDHSKLRYMYDRDSIAREVRRMMDEKGKGKDLLFIECGKTLSHGASVYLDPLTLSQATGAKVILVAGGEDDQIADDLAFVRRFVGADEAHVGGVILNKVKQPSDFKSTHLTEIQAMGLNVLGVVPFEKELTTLAVGYVAEKLFARVIAGESGLSRTIRSVAVGAMSVGAALAWPQFSAPDKLVITSGDRSDLVLACLDCGGTSAFVLTHNIVPPPSVTARATQLGVPILLVPEDTYSAAIQVTNLEPLLTKDDAEKVRLLERLARDHLDLVAIERL